MGIIEFLSAFGLGAIVNALVQAWLSQRATIATRNFEEKKEAYIGLLEAYRKTCLTSSNENQKEFGYWSVRCTLVAPQEIRTLIEEMKTADADKQQYAFNLLKPAMRKDLGITT